MKLNWTLLACASLLAVACSKSNKKAEPNMGQAFQEGEVIVKTDKLAALQAEYGGLKAEPLWPENQMYKLSGKSLAGKEKEISAEMEKKGLAKIAEPNFIVSIALADRTTDPHWLDLWGLSNVGQDAPNGTEGVEGADIGVLKAWNAGNVGSDEILVAVMDTGIDYKHPDLMANIYENKAEKGGQDKVDDDPEADKICIDEERKRCYADDVFGWNFVTGTDNQQYQGVPGKPDPMDGHGHGTHVAGTIGAVANNGIGVAGVNQKVKMIALKVLSDQGSGKTDDIIRAIRYAALKKVDVVNASFGGGGASDNFLDALEQAEKAGVLFVAAAGNESMDSDQQEAFPASYDVESIISVAATDNRDQLAEFSNYGFNRVDIAAPGVNVISTIPLAIAEKEGTPDHPYRVFSGTSMATPHVVGAAALVLAAKKDLRKKPGLVKKLLMESSDFKPQLAGRVRSGGRLNVARAIAGEVTNFLDPKLWEEQEYSYKSPSLPAGHVDVLHTIKVDGAKAIQAHIARSSMDNIDLAAVYDGALRLVSFLPGDAVSSARKDKDYWTPVVYSDSMSVRFANSLVTVTKVVKTGTYTEFEASLLEGEVMCFPSDKVGEDGSPLYDCTIWGEPSTPFGNDLSEGFKIDKIRVLK